ncbi:MAG: hypothetical protein ACOCUS_02245, partial [Polyangiales bacterium]
MTRTTTAHVATIALASWIGAALALPARARADDWLLLHPPCAWEPPARSAGEASLVYPRTGLPALVHAGEDAGSEHGGRET